MRELLELLLEVCKHEEQNTWGRRWHEIISIQDDLEGQIDEMRIKVIRDGQGGDEDDKGI